MALPYPENLEEARDKMVEALISGPGADGMFKYEIDGEAYSVKHDALVDAIVKLDDLILRVAQRVPHKARVNVVQRGC